MIHAQSFPGTTEILPRCSSPRVAVRRIRVAAAQLRRLSEISRNHAGVADRGAFSRPRHERPRRRRRAVSPRARSRRHGRLALHGGTRVAGTAHHAAAVGPHPGHSPTTRIPSNRKRWSRPSRTISRGTWSRPSRNPRRVARRCTNRRSSCRRYSWDSGCSWRTPPSTAAATSSTKGSSCTRSPCSACCASCQPEAVAQHLNPHLRKYLRLAARDLVQHDKGFQRLRSVFAVIPVDEAERTLPTRRAELAAG